MSVKEQYRKYSLITIILGLGLLLFLKMTPFMGGILGACTIYIMVRDQMLYLTCSSLIGCMAAHQQVTDRQCRHRHFCRHNYQPCRLDSPEDRI